MSYFVFILNRISFLNHSYPLFYAQRSVFMAFCFVIREVISQHSWLVLVKKNNTLVAYFIVLKNLNMGKTKNHSGMNLEHDILRNFTDFVSKYQGKNEVGGGFRRWTGQDLAVENRPPISNTGTPAAV